MQCCVLTEGLTPLSLSIGHIMVNKSDTARSSEAYNLVRKMVMKQLGVND